MLQCWYDQLIDPAFIKEQRSAAMQAALWDFQLNANVSLDETLKDLKSYYNSQNFLSIHPKVVGTN